MKYTKKQILKAFRQSFSKSDVCRIFRLHVNGTGLRRISAWIDDFSIDISHFDGGASKKIIYERITKKCPVCNKEFEALKGNKKEKRVCSRACANTHFRSGPNNGNYIHGYTTLKSKYRTICFQAYPYRCALCNWTKIVEVHHIDRERSNNNIENLIPLCANHHRLTEMNKYKEEIKQKIEEWKRNN